MKKLLLFIVSGAIIASSVSCRKDQENLSEIAEKEATINGLFNDVQNDMDETIEEKEASGYAVLKSLSAENQRVITVTQGAGDSTTFPKALKIEYSNYTSPEGRIKNGSITFTITGKYRNTGTVITTSFENFSIDGNKIEGTKTVTNTGNYEYTVVIANGKITFADGGTYTRTSSRTRKWIAGYATPRNIWDDEYEITGSAAGVNTAGDNYNHTISEALLIKLNCAWVSKGKINLQAGIRTGSINYGMGDCDNQAVATVNGKDYNITLRGRNRLNN